MIRSISFISITSFFLFLSTISYSQVRELPKLVERIFDAPSNLSEARLQDLQVFEDIVAINASFSAVNREEAKTKITELRSRVGSISELEFLIELHKIYALNMNAHDEGRFALFPRGWGSLPFRGYWFDGQYRIIRVLSGYEELLGARVTHYGNVGIDEVNVKLKIMCGGTIDFFRSVAGDALMATPAVLHHFDLIPEPDEVEVHFVMLDGKTAIRTMKPSSPGRQLNPTTAAGRLLFPNFKFSNWSPLFPKSTIPLFLDGDNPLHGEPFIYAELGTQQTPYVQLRQNFSAEKQNLPEFIEEVESKWKGKKYPYIIIDLRLDQGGNTLLTQRFFQSLDQYIVPGGKIYVALGHRTFSAGINGAALIKHGNSSEVIFVGEDIGDREYYWSETTRVNLPNNSDIKFTYSAAKHDMENGCITPECYWWYFENANPKVGEIRPDYYVPFTFENYYNGFDEILAKIDALENEKIVE